MMHDIYTDLIFGSDRRADNWTSSVSMQDAVELPLLGIGALFLSQSKDEQRVFAGDHRQRVETAAFWRSEEILG